MLEPGATFAQRYVLSSPLGEGGFGEVWRARDDQTGDDVAIKMLLPQHEDDAASLERFEREIRVGAWLNHPAIPAVLDAGRDAKSGRLFCAMELVPGSPLGRDPMSLRDVILAFDSLLDALAYAHARGVIHRDIKPDNVLAHRRETDWSIGLLDFGIVRVASGMLQGLTEDEEETGGALGSAFWMSPEQASGRASSVGPASDLYSTGIMLYEMLAGQVPFDGALAMVLFKHFTESPPPFAPRPGLPDPLPDSVLELIHWLTAKPYDARPEFAADVRRELTEILARLDVDSDQPAHPAEPSFASTLAATAAPASNRATAPGLSRATAVPTLVSSAKREGNDLARTLLRLMEPPLLGREEEQQSLNAFARAVSHQGPRAAVITGAGGSGKSRLARWLAEDVHRLGQMRVLRVNIDHAGSLTSALRTAFYRYLRSPRLERKDAEARISEVLGFDENQSSQLCDFLVAGLSEEDRRQDGVLAPIPPPISTVAARQASHHPTCRPVLIWLDGAGHDDVPAIAWWAARLLAEARERDEAVGLLWSVDASDADLSALLKTEGAVRIQLGPLSRSAGKTLVEAIAMDIDPGAALNLSDRAGCQPLLLRQMALEWVTTGSTAMPPDIHEVDDVIDHLVTRALERHPQLAELLPALVLLGRSFEKSLVRRLFDHLSLQPVDLVAIGILERDPHSDQLTFSSQSLYGRLTQRLENDPDRDSILSATNEVLLLASLTATGVSNWERARRFLTTAWESLDTFNVSDADPMRAQILDGLSRIAARQRESGALRDNAASILALAAESQRGRDTALSQLWFGFAAGLDEDYFEAEACCEAAMEAADGTEDDGLLGRIEHRLAVIQRARGNLDQAITMLESAARMMEDASDDSPSMAMFARLYRADIKRDLGSTLLSHGQLNQAEDALDGALGDYRNAGDKQFEARTLLQLVRLDRSRLAAGGNATVIGQRADEHLSQARDILEELDDRTGQAMLAWEAGRLHLTLGQRDVANNHLGLANQLFGAAGQRSGRAAVLNTLGEMARADGQLDLAEAYYRQFAQLADEINLTVHRAAARINQGWVTLEKAEPQAAGELFARALEILGDGAPSSLLVPATVGLARATAAHDTEQAAAILEALTIHRLDKDSREALVQLSDASAFQNPRLAESARQLLEQEQR